MYVTYVRWKGSNSVPLGEFDDIWLLNSEGNYYEFNPHVFADRAARGDWSPTEPNTFRDPKDNTRYIRGNCRVWGQPAGDDLTGLLITSQYASWNGNFRIWNRSENSTEYPSGENDGITLDNYDGITSGDLRYNALQNRIHITGLRSDFTYPMTTQWDGSRKALNSYHSNNRVGADARCPGWVVSISEDAGGNPNFKCVSYSKYTWDLLTPPLSDTPWDITVNPMDPYDMGFNDSIYHGLDSIATIYFDDDTVRKAAASYGSHQYGTEPLASLQYSYHGMQTDATAQIAGSLEADAAGNGISHACLPSISINASGSAANPRWYRFQDNETKFLISAEGTPGSPAGWLPSETRAGGHENNGFFGFNLVHQEISTYRDVNGVMFECGSDENLNKSCPLPAGEPRGESGELIISCTMKHNGPYVVFPILIWDVQINDEFLFNANEPHDDVCWWDAIHRVNAATLTDYPTVDFKSNVTTAMGGGQLNEYEVWENEDLGLGDSINAVPTGDNVQSIDNDLFNRTDIAGGPIKYYTEKYMDNKGQVRMDSTAQSFRLMFDEITLKR